MQESAIFWVKKGDFIAFFEEKYTKMLVFQTNLHFLSFSVSCLETWYISVTDVIQWSRNGREARSTPILLVACIVSIL